jgi:hypothetical protein
MPHLSERLAATAAGRYGIVTRDELRRDGFADSSIRRWVEKGLLMSCHQGVYRVATSPDCFESRCAAACLGDASAVVTGPAAARLWQFRHVFRPDRPYVLIEHHR